MHQKHLKTPENTLWLAPQNTHKQSAFVNIWQILDFARIEQNLKNRAALGGREKKRKEIELSIQKSKNGILPTPNSALKTVVGLRFKISRCTSKTAISAQERVFTDASRGWKMRIYDRKVYKTDKFFN